MRWPSLGNVRIPDSLKPLLIPMSTLHQHEMNPRNGDLDVIIESIRVNGYMAPILVQRSTGTIIAGNHRWQAMHALGETSIPAVMVDMDDQTAKRYLVADNESSDKAWNDNGLLIELLQEIQQFDTGLIGSGFDDDDLMRMIAEQDIEPSPEVPHPMQPALYGIYEITVSFDNENDRLLLGTELRERFGEESVREANI